MFSKSSIISIYFLLALLVVHGQERTIALRQYTSENGVSDSRITAFAKDSLGFMWIGTKDGLNRFDGKDFHIFKNIETDSTSLCSNRITCLAYSADSLLWIGTAASGFCCYDFRTGKFTTYSKNSTALNSNSINAIDYEKEKHRLWISQNNYGLQVFDLNKRKFVTRLDQFPKASYYDVTFFNDNIYASGIGLDILKINRELKTQNKTIKKVGATNNVFVGSDNKLWCGAWNNALHEFDTTLNYVNNYIFGSKKELSFSGDEILAITEDANKLLWCATKTSGILFFDLERKIFVNNITLKEKINSRINTLFKDRYNRIWIGTETGFYLYDPLLNQFNEVRIPLPEGVNSCKVFGRVITKDKKEFIAAACGLFYKLPGQSTYSHKNIIYRGETLKLTSMYKDSYEKIYIGTNKTLFLLDTATLSLSTIKSNALLVDKSFYNINGSQVNEIAEIKHHGQALIAASFYGHYIALIDSKRNNISYLYPDTSILFENLNRKFLIDSKNNFWVCGANKGISKIEIPDSVDFSLVPVSDTAFSDIIYSPVAWTNIKSGNISSLNDVFDMIEEEDGGYWLSSQGHGLVRFFPENKQEPFKSFSGEFKSLHGLVKSDKKNIWIISSAGLLNYNISSSHYTLYDRKNGIRETIGGYFFKTGTKELNVGFDGGFYSFYPDSIKINREQPRLSISRLWVMDVAADMLLLKNKLTLSYEQNFLKFYISSNCFSVNEQIRYDYLLEGIDNNWRSNGNNPLIIYTNLPPGNYKLHVKAINSSGIEGGQIILPVIIAPPFYKTSWFYGLLILIIASILYAIYRYRINNLIAIQEMRNKIARDLHDDIGSTLGSINLFSQVANVKLTQQKLEEVKPILEKIGASSREIIDKTGDAVWAINPSNDTIRNLYLRMEAYAAELLGAANIQFKIGYDNSIENTSIDMVQRKNIFLIYKEAIHNIIKYAAAAEVNITLTKHAGKIQLLVRDNGKGFTGKEYTAYNGNGLKNMKARALEIKGDLRINSSDKGVVIELLF